MPFFPRSPHSRLLGSSLIEIVIAIGLLAIFASTLFVTIGSQYLSSSNAHQSLQAISMAREGLEAAKSIRDTGWSALTVGTHGLAYATNTWSFQNASDTADGFRRTITVTALSANERQVVSTVSWIGSAQQTRTIALATNLTDWRTVTAPPRLNGNWGLPQTLGTIDLGAGIQATGVTVRNKIVYMTGVASTANKKDFFVINATDGLHPSMLASIDIGPGTNGLALSGNFTYLANNDTSNQLSIINVSATSSPTNVKNFTLTSNNSEALSVAATGTLLLMGTKNDAGAELYVVDASNAAAPLIKNTLEISADVNRISIVGNRAYLATASTTAEFMVIDISNPNIPVVKATVNLTGSASAATGLFINTQDNRAYITRQQAAGTSPEVAIYNVANPDAPTLLGSMEFGGDIPAVFAADYLMFLGTAVSNLEFQIFDVTNPAVPSYYSGLNFPQVAADIAFENNVMYVAVRSNDALRIITSQ